MEKKSRCRNAFVVAIMVRWPDGYEKKMEKSGNIWEIQQFNNSRW